MEDDVSSYIEEIIAALGDDLEISKEEIEEEFRRFLEYGVPPEQAKKSLVKKFGKDKIDRRLLKDIKPNEKNLSLVCKVITKNVREISVRGENRTIYYGLLADESAVLPFTAWRSNFPADKGDVIEIRNAYSREWQGNVQINMGERTGIKKLEENVLPEISKEPKKCKIVDIYNTFGPIEIKAKILSISEREVEIEGAKRKIFSGILGDETGKAQFTAWQDFDLKEGDTVKLTGCYARFWKGIPQIVIDERVKLEKSSKDIEVESPDLPLHKLVEMKGGIDVSTEGTIIEIMESSGYIERCPECNRLIRNNECRIHGKVKGEADLRLKLVIDNGFAGIGVIVGRELTEKLIGKTLDDCKKIIKKDGEGKLLEEIKNMLLTKRIKLRGNAFGDEYGTILIARDAELLEENIKEEAERLLQLLEAER